MKFNSWKVVASCLAILIITYLGYRIYQSFNTINIWGFQVTKSQVILVRIDTFNGKTSHAYEIRNPKLVLEVTKEASRLKKVTKITPMNFPPSKNYKPVTKLQIVSKKIGSIGGSFWFNGNDSTIWQDVNGYYWSVPKELIVNLEKDIKTKEVSKLF